MKKQIKLTESDLKNVVEGAVISIIKEYTKFDKEKMYGKSHSKEEYDDLEFNEQPSNEIVGENNNKIRVTESQLKDIIKESVNRILFESGEKHRFGLGKFGLAMDAANKASALGRYQQAYNLKKHGAAAFNKEFGTDGFKMNDFGNLDVKDDNKKDVRYFPKSHLGTIEKNSRGRDGEAYKNALKNNGFIKNKAQTAKAFPRKKMTGGLNAIETLDDKLHNGTY